MNPKDKTKIENTVDPASGIITPNIPTAPITPTQLTPSTPFTVATQKASDGSTIVPPTLTPLQAYEQNTTTNANNSQSDYEKLLADAGLIKAKEGGYQDELGATQARESYTNYANQLEGEKRALDIKTRALQQSGMTTEQSRSEASALENQSLQKQADIAILGNAAMGKYDFALTEAKRKVDLELKPLEDKLTLKKQQYENNQDKLTKLESQKVAGMINAEAADLAQTRKDKEAANTMYVNALQNKAPQSVIDNAKAIIDKGGSSNEVAKALGTYSMSMADKVDLALKTAQTANLGASTAKMYAEANTSGTGKPPTEGQILNAGYAERIKQSNDILDSNTGTFKKMNYIDFKLSESKNQIANKVLTPEQRQVALAMRNFITAKLRKESGAAISQTEFDDARLQYFPALGDDKKTLDAKKQLRDSVYNNLVTGSGSAYKGTTQLIGGMSTLSNDDFLNIPSSSKIISNQDFWSKPASL